MRKLAAAGLMMFSFLLPLSVSAEFGAGTSGLTETGGAAYGDSTITKPEFYSIGAFVGTYVIKPVLGILGVIFLCLMIYGGIIWMTAMGNEKRVSKAKDIMIAAVTGTVIVLAAYAITTELFKALAP